MTSRPDMSTGYYVPPGGMPEQTAMVTDRARFTQAYAIVPRGALRDIVASRLPHWTQTRCWVLARPLSGFAETFSQYIVEVGPGGGSAQPDDDPDAEAVIFVVGGAVEVLIDGAEHSMAPGGYAYLPAGIAWSLRNTGESVATFHWIRKTYQAVAGIDLPAPFVTREQDVPLDPMPGAQGRWSTQRFVAPDDLRHDMQVNIVTFEPGAILPFAETHVMEHGLYVLEGKAVYLLNTDWVEVQEGDFMWLRAFCPQACYAGGPGRFRYLLYKDVNRHVPLTPF